jgi:hypothetical protein
MGDVFTVSALFSYTSRVTHAIVVDREAVPPSKVADLAKVSNGKSPPKNTQYLLPVTPSSPSYTLTGSASDGF